MKVEPGQVYLMWHNHRTDPFLVLGQRAFFYDTEQNVFKWTVVNLTNLQELYVYENELAEPDSQEDYYAVERLF